MTETVRIFFKFIDSCRTTVMLRRNISVLDGLVNGSEGLLKSTNSELSWATVMLRRNISVVDGLVNGIRGWVMHIEGDRNEDANQIKYLNCYIYEENG